MLQEVAGIGGEAVGGLLLLYGLAGVAGNFAGGAAAVRDPWRALLVISAGIGVTVLALGAAGGSPATSTVLLAAWGLAYGGVSVSTRTWLMAAAPAENREAVAALFAGVFNTAIAAGALCGGRAVDTLGAPGALWLGGAWPFWPRRCWSA